MQRRVVLWLVPLLAAVSLTSCVSTGLRHGRDRAGRLAVVAGFYPLAYLVEAIGGDGVHVIDLTPPGVEPHDIELTARQVATVQDAGLVVYLKGLAPAIDAAVGDAHHRLDVTAAVPLREHDPHIWLDPVRMVALARSVGAALAAADPARSASFAAATARVVDRLVALDRDYGSGLAHCHRTEVVTSHSAFGYLTRRYGLVQLGITGLVPDAEPGPGRLAEVARLAKAHGTTTIFFESIVSPKVAETVASTVGASTAVLDPIETQPRGGDYLTAMRANLAALRTGLDCT